jgi:hypothetical protein
MKKKLLLRHKALNATSAMMEALKNDKEEIVLKTFKSWSGMEESRRYSKYKYIRYYRAAVMDGILKVSVFTRKRLKAGIREPQFEIYIDRENNEFLTYEPAAGKWRTAKINNLQYDIEGYYCACHYNEWSSQADRKMVNKYLNTGANLDIFQAVLDFQANIRDEWRQKKYRTEIEWIDATMKQVPEPPKGMEEWIIKNCFKETLFYERDRPYRWPKVFCTHCGQWMDAPGKPEHGKEVRCPKCNAQAVYRSWNKQKTVGESVQVIVLQRLMDDSGYILRKFTAGLVRRHEKGWKNIDFSLREHVRARLNEEFEVEENFEYGQFKYTGVDRWCHQCRGAFCNYSDHPTIGSGYMYTPNLKRVLRNEKFRNMDLKRLFKGGERKEVTPQYLLRKCKKHPYLEYLEKSGLTAIMDEIMLDRIRRYDIEKLFDKNAERIHEVMKLDKQRFQRLRRWNGNAEVLRALQVEKEGGGKLTDDHIKFILERKVEISEVEIMIGKTGASLPRMLNYMQRQMEILGMTFIGIRQFYEDYLDMAEDRGMDLKDKIVWKQPQMRKFHDKYLEERNREENTKRDKEVNEKFPDIQKNYKKNLEHFAYSTKEFIIMVPRKASDITREGRLQHHCVGASDRYLNRMNTGRSFILFLRKQEDPTIPFYTLEVDWDGEIEQWYAAYDRKPDKERIEEVLKEYSKEIRRREAEIKKKQRKAIKEMGTKEAARPEPDSGHMGAALIRAAG